MRAIIVKIGKPCAIFVIKILRILIKILIKSLEAVLAIYDSYIDARRASAYKKLAEAEAELERVLSDPWMDLLSEKNLNKKVLVKKNPVVCLIEDAERFRELSFDAKRNGDENTEAMCARSAILLYIVSLEGIVNAIYQHFDMCSNRKLKNKHLKEKWLDAPEDFIPIAESIFDENGIPKRKPEEPVSGFDEKSPLFTEFLELKKIRDDFVHLKLLFEVKTIKDIGNDSNEEYPLTHIPKNIEFWRSEHVDIAKDIYDSMTGKLNGFMKGELEELLSAKGFILFRFDDDMPNLKKLYGEEENSHEI